MSIDMEGGEDVLIVGLSKKEHEVVQRKACRVIVNKACKMAIEKKGQCDEALFLSHVIQLENQKPPHRVIWINMLCGYCCILDPNTDNVNAQPHILMNTMKNRLEENWEYVGYDFPTMNSRHK